MPQSLSHRSTHLCWLLWPDGASTSRLGFLAGWRVCRETTSWWALWRSSGCQAFPVCFTVPPLFSEPCVLPAALRALPLGPSGLPRNDNSDPRVLFSFFLQLLPTSYLSGESGIWCSWPVHSLEWLLLPGLLSSRLPSPLSAPGTHTSPGPCHLEPPHLRRHLAQTWAAGILVLLLAPLSPHSIKTLWGLQRVATLSSACPTPSNPPERSSVSMGESLATLTGSWPRWLLVLLSSLSDRIPVWHQDFHLTLLLTVVWARLSM